MLETSSRPNMTFKFTGVQRKTLSPMVLGFGNTVSKMISFMKYPSRLIMAQDQILARQMARELYAKRLFHS